MLSSGSTSAYFSCTQGSQTRMIVRSGHVCGPLYSQTKQRISVPARPLSVSGASTSPRFFSKNSSYSCVRASSGRGEVRCFFARCEILHVFTHTVCTHNARTQVMNRAHVMNLAATWVSGSQTVTPDGSSEGTAAEDEAGTLRQQCDYEHMCDPIRLHHAVNQSWLVS